jgi:hypothetical protein
MGKYELNKFYDTDLRPLVDRLDNRDKGEVIRFMVSTFIKASRLYYRAMNLSDESSDAKIFGELKKLRAAFELRVDQKVSEAIVDDEIEIHQKETDNQSQFVSDATIELYFLLQEISKDYPNQEF